MRPVGWGTHRMGGVPPLADTGRSREGRSQLGTGGQAARWEGPAAKLIRPSTQAGQTTPIPMEWVSSSSRQQQGQAVTSPGRSLILSFSPQFRPGFELRMDGRGWKEHSPMNQVRSWGGPKVRMRTGPGPWWLRSRRTCLAGSPLHTWDTGSTQPEVLPGESPAPLPRLTLEHAPQDV